MLFLFILFNPYLLFGICLSISILCFNLILFIGLLLIYHFILFSVLFL